MSEFRKPLVYPGEGRDTLARGSLLYSGWCVRNWWRLQLDPLLSSSCLRLYVYVPLSATVIWIRSTSCNGGVGMDIKGCGSGAEPKQL